jgi:hypothetical protein
MCIGTRRYGMPHVSFRFYAELNDHLPWRSVHPFQRCLHCNTVLRSVPKGDILDRLPPKIQDLFLDFTQCPSCDRFYCQLRAPGPRGVYLARHAGWAEPLLWIPRVILSRMKFDVSCVSRSQRILMGAPIGVLLFFFQGLLSRGYPAQAGFLPLTCAVPNGVSTLLMSDSSASFIQSRISDSL